MDLRSWTGSWTGASDNPSAASAVSAMIRVICAASVRGAGGRTSHNPPVVVLTAATATTVLIAPAGAGKSHTMAEFARLWTSFTGRRVIGLTTSTTSALADPLLTSWQRRPGCAPSLLQAECKPVLRYPAGSRLLAALSAAPCVFDPRIKRQARPRRKSSKSVRSFGVVWVYARPVMRRDPVTSDDVAA
jgi:hypothetical protein